MGRVTPDFRLSAESTRNGECSGHGVGGVHHHLAALLVDLAPPGLPAEPDLARPCCFDSASLRGCRFTRLRGQAAEGVADAGAVGQAPLRAVRFLDLVAVIDLLELEDEGTVLAVQPYGVVLRRQGDEVGVP